MADTLMTAIERDTLLTAAREVSEQAYVPYSKFNVGAAVLTERGNIYRGCNVENASYGLTVCAERSAIFAAVAAEGPEMRTRAIAVLTSSDEPASPCGACRQVLLEFNPDAIVFFRGENGIEERTVRELLPAGFRLE